jgi:hypothetical protein
MDLPDEKKGVFDRRIPLKTPASLAKFPPLQPFYRLETWGR